MRIVVILIVKANFISFSIIIINLLLFVLVDFQTDDLIKTGKLLADSRADIMSSGIGVAVRRGARKPDIATVEAFKQTMLKAKSMTYLKEGASTIHFRKLFVRLGIADAIKVKAVETAGEQVPNRSPTARSSSA